MESALDKISSTSDGSSPKESCPENSDVKDMNDLSRKVSHKPNEKYGWKRNKKRRKQISREKVDWSKIEMSAVEKHSGYIDFSPWIISKQTTGPSGSPVKVDSFLPPVPDAQRIQLPLTEATHEYADNIPESVRQFERQMKKQRAEQRVARPVTIEDLRVVYIDKYIVVANKPAGRLTVPGLRGNPSLAQLIFDTFGCESGLVAKVVVHRLDMDTSGLVVFARTDDALSELHRSFRDMEISKTYEALVCGHLADCEGRISFPLQRDHKYPPWMRVSTEESEKEASEVVEHLRRVGWKSLIRKAPKPCETLYKVIALEQYGGEPVTRLALTPLTGRTHQLRVHCAAIGHHIVADQTYGFQGEGSEDGGLDELEIINKNSSAATLQLKKKIHSLAKAEKKELCLHAKRLCLPHPITGKLMIFEAQAPF